MPLSSNSQSICYYSISIFHVKNEKYLKTFEENHDMLFTFYRPHLLSMCWTESKFITYLDISHILYSNWALHNIHIIVSKLEYANSSDY